MTEEEKQILIADLCARLPYGLMVECIFAEMNWDTNKVEFETEKKLLDMGDLDWLFHDAAEIKPYLRPMSSMTEKERKEYYATMDKETQRNYPNSCDWSETTYYSLTVKTFDWLNANRFDYRGWIDDGKAYKAPDGMYDSVASFQLDY